ncbi:MAG: hypothetical protein A2Y89_03125 [Chloroflexi bacterium RBG_13_51_18]|nr:MAG: hypothetical protein A2Y89_03125 [Chloroflexi bacterium RBG_13_51_18]
MENNHINLRSGIPISIALGLNNTTWTNMPAAETEFAATYSTRTAIDVKHARLARLVTRLNAAAAANAKLKLQYAVTEGGTYTDLCSVILGATTGVKVGGWTDVPAAAQKDVFIRVVGIDGDGVADPTFILINLQLV